MQMIIDLFGFDVFMSYQEILRSADP